MSDLVIRDEDVHILDLVRELERAGAVTPTSFDLSSRPDLGYDELEAIAAFVGRVHDASRWWQYDVLNHVEMRHGELVAQAAEAMGLQPQTIENGMSIVRRVPKQRRRSHVKFSLHAEVAPLSPNDQRRWLKVAEVEKLTKAELRARVRAEQNGTPDVLPPPEPAVCESCGRPL